MKNNFLHKIKRIGLCVFLITGLWLAGCANETEANSLGLRKDTSVNADVEVDADVKVNTDVKADADVKVDTDVKVNTDVKVDADVKVDTDVKTDTDVKVDADVKADESAEGKTDINAETEGKAEMTAEPEEESLGNPRSSYGLGSATYLRGRNVLISLFVTTPESSFSDNEKAAALEKVGTAVSYLEKQAASYGVEAEFVYDFAEHPDLVLEVQTDFAINEEEDFVDRLDEEIALWKEELVSYEKVKASYEADGIAMLIYVNNPGISYAIVYDGTDSQQETVILFTQDYYRPGKAEAATVYAHEILHLFGAHDLYEEAEFTREVPEYVALTYPEEIMYTVEESGGKITAEISEITAYHLGWIEEAEAVKMFPQLERE